MARILVAEHNKSTSEYIYTSLKKTGNAISMVDNCLDAWRASSQESFDVLLVDVSMPGIDGFVLAQKALQDNPNLQIVFITGFAAVAMDTFTTPSYAPAPMITRPFHLSEIAARVQFLTGQGGLPVKGNTEKTEGNVVYADFTSKTAPQSQHIQV